jgi:oxaloacetate decarboxylase beta subunit
MGKYDLGSIFQGISTLLQSDAVILYSRIGLILLGILLVYLGRKEVLEPLVMIPMGLGMAAINASVLIMPGGVQGNLFLDPLITDHKTLIDVMQIDFLQPVYNYTFSNGLIACLIFMGIGTMLDIGFVLARPVQSMTLALFAEFGSFAVLPIAHAIGLSLNESASVALIGGADGPMVLFGSLNLAKNLFVPITIVAYLYLGLTYGGYPYLVRLLVPKRLRSIKIDRSREKVRHYSPATKVSMAVVLCIILCLLFPVAAPLIFSLFIGNIIKESGLKHLTEVIAGPMLYGSTFFLGILLGVLCDAHILLNPVVLKLLALGILALLLSGIGGIAGGYVMYFVKRRNFNPVIGIAAVSCIPTTAKVAQKIVAKENSASMVLPDALGANVMGVITSAIIAGLYVTVIPMLMV